MSGLTDILGSLVQAQLSKSGNQRMRNSMSAGGPLSGGGLNDILGNLGGALSGLNNDAPGNTQGQVNSQSSGGGFGGLGSILGSALGDIGRSLGSNDKVATGGLGALIGALVGGGSSSAKGAVGGGVMAILGSLAYSALKNAGSAPSKAPVGLIDNQTTEQKAQMDHEADLAIRAMINAAKADGHIDQEELQRIVGQLQKDGIDDNERQQLAAEMKKPFDLDSLVNAAKNDPQVAAQIYIASLLAIEVDTGPEQAYMQQLASGLGLPQEAVAHIETALGMA